MKYPDNDIIGEVGGTGTALGYDEAGRLTSIPGILTSVTYNALGAPLVQTNANGTTTTKTYDEYRSWLTGIATTAPSVTLQNLTYTLNDAGMATEVTSLFGSEGWTYGYDDLNRLTSATNAGSSADNQIWTYDNLGRITSNSRIGNYAYDDPLRPHAVTSAGSNTYSQYDGNGNLVLGGGRTLSWDANNRITQVSMGASTTSFVYGPDGDRIKKVAGSTVAKYPFGDDYEIAADGTVTKYFNAGFGVIAKKVGTTLSWLHTDRMGSINATTDSAGVEVLRRSYRTYGELLGQTGTATESLGYIGQRTDEETGLTYLHARYYDPVLGIFLSPDPAGADRNTYRYSFGDSVSFKDPSGLIPCRPGYRETVSFGGGPTKETKNVAQVKCRPAPTSQETWDFFHLGQCLATGCLYDPVTAAEETPRMLRAPRFPGTGNDVLKPCGGKPAAPRNRCRLSAPSPRRLLARHPAPHPAPRPQRHRERRQTILLPHLRRFRAAEIATGSSACRVGFRTSNMLRRR